MKNSKEDSCFFIAPSVFMVRRGMRGVSKTGRLPSRHRCDGLQESRCSPPDGLPLYGLETAPSSFGLGLPVVLSHSRRNGARVETSVAGSVIPGVVAPMAAACLCKVRDH